MAWQKLCVNVRGIVEKEPRLVRLPSSGKVVFVGDTHGDLDATERVLHRYLKAPYHLVFLGDYVDRGIQSPENLEYLLNAKAQHPQRITLLAGNHEGFMVKKFLPADFWEDLDEGDRKLLGDLFFWFPLAATSENGILGVHGGLPDLKSLEEINQIHPGDGSWDRITWGDFLEHEGEFLGDWGGRPQFGDRYFRRMMDRYQRKLVIRSHQPNSPEWMFDESCLTLMTSRDYKSRRTIAIVDLGKELRNSKDVIVEEI
jgi:predicted phosphodiesterase